MQPDFFYSFYGHKLELQNQPQNDSGLLIRDGENTTENIDETSQHNFHVRSRGAEKKANSI